MNKKIFLKKITQKQNPKLYAAKDSKLSPSLRTLDLIGLGTGMVVGTAIFTLPGIVAAKVSANSVGVIGKCSNNSG